MTDTAADAAPLDEVMLAMDVVDTLRHRQTLVERELGAAGRDQDLIARLRAIYADQGIEVPDSVLASGVAALREDRFRYEPPAPGLGVSLAHLYIGRARLLRRGTALAAGLLALLAVYYFAVQAPVERRASELEALPATLAARRDAALAIASGPAGTSRDEELFGNGMAALARSDGDAALRESDALGALAEELGQTYALRIVSEPGERSGVWRVPVGIPGARNHYLIVEAVDASGRRLQKPIESEETGRTELVSRWGVRVSEDVFERVRADKADDGILQDDRVGAKRRGQLEIDYELPVLGGAITSW